MVDSPLPLTDNIRAWLAHGERGLSSETIVGRLCGLPLTQYESAPLDLDDLRRCVRLLDACPELRPLLPRMTSVSPEWERLVARWDQLEATFRKELAAGNACPKTYRMFRAALSGKVRR